jgi:hypothetical protein
MPDVRCRDLFFQTSATHGRNYWQLGLRISKRKTYAGFLQMIFDKLEMPSVLRCRKEKKRRFCMRYQVALCPDCFRP